MATSNFYYWYLHFKRSILLDCFNILYTFQNIILNSINHWFKNERSRVKVGRKETKTKSAEKQCECDTKGSTESSKHCDASDREDEMQAEYILEDVEASRESYDAYEGSNVHESDDDMVDLTME